MYNFTDVTATTSGGTLLPSEALKINGAYIEDLIPEYRTLTVEGREALSPEISSYNTGYRDGSLMSGRRYPARIIRITYQIIAKTSEEFRKCYNKLGAILNVKEAELIFNDEQDKYFIGTPSSIGEVPPGRNAVVGEFEILCLDPFKYSVNEFEAEIAPSETSILIDYNGTYKSFPTLRAEFSKESEASTDGKAVVKLTGKGECGYVAFFNEREKIIQLGDPDEVDIETSAYDASQTLINARFDNQNGWETAAKSQWTVNKGLTPSDSWIQTGSIGIGEATPAVSATPARPGTPGTSSGEIARKQIKEAWSYSGQPNFHYVIEAVASNRTASSVDITVIIKTNLQNSDSYFLEGLELKGTFYIGSQFKTCMIKNYAEEWRGTTVHSKSLTFTVAIAQGATDISNMYFEATRIDTTGGTAGKLAKILCESITIPAYVAPTAGTSGTAGVAATYYLTAKNYGVGDGWNGTSITREIPADSSGVRGATNFELSFSAKISIGSGSDGTSQKGAFQVMLTSGSGTSRKMLLGMNVYKNGSGKISNLRFYVGGEVKDTLEIDISKDNGYFSKDTSVKITKEGGRVTFAIGSMISKTYIDDEIAESVINEITFSFFKYGSVKPLAYNGLYWVQFVKNNCVTWKDVPNKFRTNDVVEADCRTGEITHNGVAARSLGALGNDWEGFYLLPGLNQIGTSYSDWVVSGFKPTFKVKYREVYL